MPYLMFLYVILFFIHSALLAIVSMFGFYVFFLKQNSLIVERYETNIRNIKIMKVIFVSLNKIFFS